MIVEEYTSVLDDALLQHNAAGTCLKATEFLSIIGLTGSMQDGNVRDGVEINVSHSKRVIRKTTLISSRPCDAIADVMAASRTAIPWKSCA
jgi:hypothetical protein